MTGKYDPLEKYLRSLPRTQEEVTLSFESIEQVLNDKLPPSAHEHRAWWGNQQQGTHVEAIAWMDVMESWDRWTRSVPSSSVRLATSA